MALPLVPDLFTQKTNSIPFSLHLYSLPLAHILSSLSGPIHRYESAIARPALVLNDLANSVWPAHVAPPAAGCSQYLTVCS